jgi:hypothetical protein
MSASLQAVIAESSNVYLECRVGCPKRFVLLRTISCKSLFLPFLISMVLLTVLDHHLVLCQTFSPTFPVGLEVPVDPIPFKSGGKIHLVYELHVNSFRAGDLTLKRIEVLNTNGGSLIAAYQDKTLADMLARPGAGPQIGDRRQIGPGMKAIVFLWVTFDTLARVPKILRHRLYFKIPGSENDRVVEGGDVVVNAKGPITIGPPFRGSGWVARFVSNTSFHRRGFIPVNGRASIAQRFAIDWGKYGEDGKILRSGDGSRNSDFYIYGEEVLAVAGGMVVGVKDDIPENNPQSATPVVPVTLDTAAGNNVVLDIGSNHYVLYAHLQPKSIRVKVGDRVRRGQALGLIGNSGNSVGPHLHFHIADSSRPLTGEGVPFVIDSFELKATETPEEFQKGELSAKPPLRQKRFRELPTDSSVISVPQR